MHKWVLPQAAPIYAMLRKKFSFTLLKGWANRD
jgi:hypothetical protein